MIVSHSEVRSRIDQLKLSHEGYSRQLTRPGLTEERRERLETSVRLLGEEMATLETLSQFGRVEPDRDKIEAEVRRRLESVQARLAKDEALAGLELEERDLHSGEVRALQWALGEDKLMRDVQEWSDQTAHDPTRLERNLPVLLLKMVREGADAGTRAIAAYDLGKLHIAEAIPALADALEDEAAVAEVSWSALLMFSDEELQAAGLGTDVLARVAEARAE